MLTPDQLASLTWLACETRRTTYGCAAWDSPGTHQAISSICGSWAFTTAVDHVLAHARDPKARTPFAMKGTAPTLAPLDRHPHPLRAGDPEECRIHIGQRVGHCRGCAADELVGDQPQPRRREGVPAPDGWRDGIRAAMGGRT